MRPSGSTAAGVLRAAPWGTVWLLTAGVGCLLALASLLPTSPVASWLVLLSLALAASAAAFALDEDAAAVVDATPVPASHRLGWRLVVVAVPGAAGVAGLAALGAASPGLAWGRLVLVLAGCLGLGCAAAGVLRSRGLAAPGELASVVAGVGVALVLGGEPLARWVRFFPLGPDTGWSRTAALWLGLLLLSGLALGRSTRDPAARRGAHLPGVGVRYPRVAGRVRVKGAQLPATSAPAAPGAPGRPGG